MAASGHSSGEAVVGVCISFTVLATVATLLRLYTRLAIVRNAGVDDVVITVALSLTILLTITMCQQVRYGMGRHAATLSENDDVQSLVWFWASVWVYYLALCFAKLSILLQYLRIFPEKGFRMRCYILIGTVVGWTFWAFFSALFACWPIRSFWDPSIKGKCLNRLAVWFSNAVMNILTDVCTAFLPLPVLKNLHLPSRQKLVLQIVFALGGVTCIISILRLSALYAISKSKDVSYDNPLAAIWSNLEVNVGILCSCIPTLKGGITKFFPSLFTTSSFTNSNHNRQSVFELGGLRNKSHQASCTATIDRDERDSKKTRRMSKMSKSLVVNGTNFTFDFKGTDEEDVDSERGRDPGSSLEGIKVTTVVSQAEERKIRDDDTRTQETVSVRGMRPAVPYEGA